MLRLAENQFHTTKFSDFYLTFPVFQKFPDFFSLHQDSLTFPDFQVAEHPEFCLEVGGNEGQSHRGPQLRTPEKSIIQGYIVGISLHYGKDPGTPKTAEAVLMDLDINKGGNQILTDFGSRVQMWDFSITD